MGDEGSTNTTTTTQNNDPWSGQQPFLTQGFNEASRLYGGNKPQYYPGQTVTDQSAQTLQGQGMVMGQAERNADLVNRTAGGEFLSAGNPYFTGMVDQIAKGIRPTLDSAFAGAGRLGSGAHEQAFSSALADTAGKLAYQNYGDERGRQVAASQDYSPMQAMLGIGQQLEGKQGEYLGDMAKRWDFEQNRDANKLAQYMGLIGNRSYGSTGTSTQVQPMTGNPWMQAAGTGIAGIGALGQVGQGADGLLKLFAALKGP